MPIPLVAAATVGRVAATVASTAARVGATAARAGGTAARAGGTASRIGTASQTAGNASRALTTARVAGRAVHQGTQSLSNVAQRATSATSPAPQRGAAYSPQNAMPQYSYGNMTPSPQFMNADPHYGMPVGQQHSGYSGLDSAEATTGAVMRRDAPARPMPLNSSTISTMGRAMAWQSPTTLIGKGAQGSFFDFGEQSQGSPYRPQGG